MSVRSLTFTHEQGLDDAPQDYAGKPVPGAYLEGAFYPAALSGDGGVLADFGLSFVIDKVLKIESEVDYMGEVTSLPTSQGRYGIGAVYRHRFGETGPTLKAGLRLNSLGFSIDKTMSPIELDIPNVDYTYLDPGVRLRYPFGEVAAFGEVRALLPLTAGEVQQIDEYGTATMFGIDLDLGAEYALSPKLTLRAGGRLTRISFDFDGSGARTDRDGDPQPDVGGALDQYIGGYVTVGYAF